MKFSKIKNLFFLALLPAVFASQQSFASSETVSIDGSSTVFPVVEAVAEEFRNDFPKIRVNIGVSGTGGGFKKFTIKETDISNASRPIKPTEVAAAKKNKVEYTEIPVAYDGLTVVINPKNTWATQMTPAELKKLWDAGSTVKNWSDLNKAWPNRAIKLFGPGTDSGTFDYFTEEINGKSGKSRSDFVKSEDDNVLVKGVAGDVDAMGYFGYSYYKENQKTLKAVAVHNGKKYVLPSEKTINDGSYAPLSRPLFIYVNKESFKREEVNTFVTYLVKSMEKIAGQVGFVPMPAKSYKDSLSKLGKL